MQTQNAESVSLVVRSQMALDAADVEAGVPRQRVSHADPSQRELFQDVTLEFGHGRCAWFALAAAEKFELPLVAIADKSGGLIHVMCRAGEHYFDAYGLGTEDQVKYDFTHFMGRRVRDDNSLTLYETNEAVVRAAFCLQGAEHDAEIAQTEEVVDRLVQELGLKLRQPRLSYRHP